MMKNKSDGLRLPRLISDGMVLQRNTKNRIWGRAFPGEPVQLDFLGGTYQTVADAAGKWALELPPGEAGGPYTMQITGSKRIELKDILIGEVWLCSGQSNMQLPVERVKYRYPREIREAENPLIRQFLVSERFILAGPAEDLADGAWEAADPQTVLRFSAVGYFFAAELFARYRVPIGLITAAAGGSAIETWMSTAALADFPETRSRLEKYRSDEDLAVVRQQDQAAVEAWHRQLELRDEGLKGPEPRWFNREYNDSAWSVMPLPASWSEFSSGKISGVIWFRRELELPGEMARKPARLWLGCMIDSDMVYVNGTLVGSTGYRYPPRIYDIPAGLLEAGRNVIAIRLVAAAGEAGFVKGKPYRLVAGDREIELAGEWRYRVGAECAPMPEALWVPSLPFGLYNGMIAPLLRFRMRGVIWYQGESNTDSADKYPRLFKKLITDWREKGEQGTFPFLFVQLAGFGEKNRQPAESDWALLREAQQQALDLPGTAMVTAIDLGEWNDLHPLAKKEVGLRLALAACRLAYGEDIEYSGPVLEAAEFKPGKVILSFSHTGSGLMVRGGGEPKHFALAAQDGVFRFARARLRENRVEVWHESIGEPVAVRYAWADNPEEANLYNREGLPALPFRITRPARPR